MSISKLSFLIRKTVKGILLTGSICFTLLFVIHLIFPHFHLLRAFLSSLFVLSYIEIKEGLIELKDKRLD